LTGRIQLNSKFVFVAGVVYLTSYILVVFTFCHLVLIRKQQMIQI